VVILQPSYIPWRGYFDQIHKSDIFVFYDCVQYDKHGWRNRNRIKSHQGTHWLSVPVLSKKQGVTSPQIKDVQIDWRAPWPQKHLKSVCQNYGKAPYFYLYEDLLDTIYSRRDKFLADFTSATTELIARNLGIHHTRFIRSSALHVEGSKTERILQILMHLGATHYISGPSAECYLEKEKFKEAGISLEFMRYHYPEYPQMHGSFEPQITVLDLMFNLGPKAGAYIWGQ